MARVVYNVPLIPQCGTLTCWYAAAQMVVRWNRRHPRGNRRAGADIDSAAVTAAVCGGNIYINLLTPSAVATFARSANLQATYQSVTSTGLAQLLTTYGPLWYGGKVRGYRGVTRGAHVVVITGSDGDAVYINDPAPSGVGGQFTYRAQDLFQDIQQEAGIPFLHG
jgi:hypothetical protein